MSGSSRSAKEVFLEMLEEDPGERGERLARLAGDDPELAARVERLLAAHGRAEAFEPVRRGRGTLLGSGRVVGDYELQGIVGEGGAGVVYRARQVSLDRIVALKVLRAGRFATEPELARFRTESEVAARLDHPRIVPVYEVGELEGAPYFTMKLIEGASLAECLDELREDPRRAAGLVAEVARAVHHGHQRGVLHRDLKPSNVLLDRDGSPHVADFGIAKRLDARGPRTYTGSFRGTPAYMAPEQVAGREVTVRTDVYALGGLLYELLTGRPPALGQGLAEILRSVQELDPPAVRTLAPAAPRDLETIAALCLAKDPARRYGSAEELAQELERWSAGEPIRGRRVSALERGWLFWRRRPLVASLVVTVAVLVAALAVGATVTSVRLGEHLARAQEAEEEAKERLRASLLAGARLHHASRRPGRRAQGLGLLRAAADLRAGPDLLNEAIALAVLPDLELEREWPSTDNPPALAFDLDFEAHVRPDLLDRLVLVDGRGGERVLAGSEGSTIWVAVFDRSCARLAVKRHGRNGEAPLLEVWDVPRGERLARLAENVSGRSLAFSGDGRVLAYGTLGGDLVLRDLDAGQERARIPLESHANELRLDPSGQLLALALHSGALELRRVGDGERLASFEHDAPLYSVDFSPDGRLALVGCGDAGIHVWELEGGTRLQRLAGHQAEVVHVRASPDGHWWVSSAWDELGILWDARSGEQVLAASARPLEFSRDGRRLGFATSSRFGVWKLVGDEVVTILHGHEGKSPTSLDVSPDGRLLASGGSDGALLRRLADGELLARLVAEPVRAVGFRAADELWVAGEDSGLLRFKGLEPGPGPPTVVVPGRARALALPADGAWIAALVDQEVLLLEPDGTLRARAVPNPGLHRLAASKDGRWLAGGNWQGQGARVFDPANGALLVDLAPGERGVEVAFDPAGTRVVVATGREYRIFRTESFEHEHTVPRELDLAARAGAATFSPGGDLLALALTHRLVGLVDPRDGALLARLEPAAPQPLSELRFTPGGERLLLGTQTQRVLVWDFERLDAVLAGAGLGALAPGLGRR